MKRRALRAALAVALFASGCKLFKLRSNVEILDQATVIGGRVSHADPHGAPIFVVLVAADGPEVLDEYLLPGPGTFFFTPLPGRYRVAAFEDLNRNFVYEPDEPAAWYGSPDPIEVVARQRAGDADLRLPAAAERALGIAVALSPKGRAGSAVLPPIATGEVVSLDDPRFDRKNGDLGLWQPVDFLLKIEAGFYFLEKYDPDKTPVLFVHGAGATPRDFAYLIAHLDRRKFQPWVMYYPSGVELDKTALSGARWLRMMSARYGFEHLVVVAHSMGGLVSRAMLNRLVVTGDSDKLTLYVTLSTPWGGFASAESGVQHSPVVMPMWRSMASNSEFLGDLFAHPLPCPYYLLFSYQGRSLMLGDVASDGVVAVSSELPLQVQEQAHKVYGFDRSHMGILNAPDVSALLNALLAESAE